MLWIKKNGSKVLSFGLMMVIGMSLGVFIAQSQSAFISEEDDSLELAMPAAIGEEARIYPDTKVNVSYRFLYCNHTIEKDETNGELNAMTLDEVREMWPDVRAAAMQGKEAIIEREIEAYCPEHYVLFNNEVGRLCVSHTAEENLAEEAVTVLTYDTSELPKDVQELLYEGIVFSSLEEINAYLEDVES